MIAIKDIAYGEKLLQRLDIYLPEKTCDYALVFFHGGGLERGTKDEAMNFAQFLTDKGIAVISADYSLYPDAHYPEFICDAALAVMWVKEHLKEYCICDKIFIGGSSAGGYISQMLCFDSKYLSRYGLTRNDFSGFILDAGQPTVHYNVLREAGEDTRKVIVDERASLYHVCQADYPPIMIIVSDNDMENRYEQTMLLYSTLKHFGNDMNKVCLKVMPNSRHCEYVKKSDADGNNLYGIIIYEFIKTYMEN